MSTYKGPDRMTDGVRKISFFTFHFSLLILGLTNSGGYSGGVPPLPIPNREVKPARADGTAMQCGRVGRRLLFTRAAPKGAAFFVSTRRQDRQ